MVSLTRDFDSIYLGNNLTSILYNYLRILCFKFFSHYSFDNSQKKKKTKNCKENDENGKANNETIFTTSTRILVGIESEVHAICTTWSSLLT